MRAHDLQPVPFDGFGRVSSWLAEHRYRSTATRLFEAAAFPESWDIGLPRCLDGPMRINDDSVLWLADERVFMRAVIGLGTPVLGFCLDPAGVAAPRDGAQAIAYLADGNAVISRMLAVDSLAFRWAGR